MSSKRKRKKIYLNTVQINRHFYIEKIKLKIERFFFEKNLIVISNLDRYYKRVGELNNTLDLRIKQRST